MTCFKEDSKENMMKKVANFQLKMMEDIKWRIIQEL